MSVRLAAHIRHQAGDFSLDIALEAAAGITALLGPSGAGKTMLLNAIAGLIRPHEGHVHLNGRPLFSTAENISQPPEARQIGYVFQDAKLFPHLSVLQNLSYGRARASAVPHALSFDEVIDLLALGELLERRPHHLSGGEKQRVGIGRALLSAPHLLLMDEPLASLDPKRRGEILPFLDALHQKLKLPVLYVTHNVDESLRLADRLVVMDKGRAVAQGGIEEVLNEENVQALLFGQAGDVTSEPVTFLSGRCLSAVEDVAEIETAWGTFLIPARHIAEGDIRHLRIQAREVALTTRKPEGLSIQNAFEARIKKITSIGSGLCDLCLVCAADEEAPLLRARITRRAVYTLGLEEGATVWPLIKTAVLARPGTITQ